MLTYSQVVFINEMNAINLGFKKCLGMRKSVEIQKWKYYFFFVSSILIEKRIFEKVKNICSSQGDDDPYWSRDGFLITKTISEDLNF